MGLLNESKGLTEAFDKFARLYDFEKYFFFPLRKKAAKFLGLPANSKILDVATGTGAQAYELAKLGYDVTGIDLSSGMLAQAKKKLSSKLKLKFLPADATQIPFNDNSFDASTVSLALHDMTGEVGAAVLIEMQRVTKEGGIILIVEYMEPRRRLAAKFSHFIASLYETSHYQKFITKGLDGFLTELGFKVAGRTDFLGMAQIVRIVNAK